jgi:hypothetical protein
MKKILYLISCLVFIALISSSFAQDGPNLTFSMSHQYSDYTLKITNNDSTDLTGVTMQIYILGSTYEVAIPQATGPSNESPYDSAKRKTYKVFQTISKDGLAIGSTQTLEVPLGKVEFKSADTAAAAPGGGKGPAPVYEGFAVQVSVLGHVILTKTSSENVHFLVAFNAAAATAKPGDSDTGGTMAPPAN